MKKTEQEENKTQERETALAQNNETDAATTDTGSLMGQNSVETPPPPPPPHDEPAGDGSILCFTQYDGARQKEILVSIFVCAIVMIVLGGLLTLLYILLNVIWYVQHGFGFTGEYTLFLGVLMLAVGITYLFVYNKNVKTAERTKHEDIYRFYRTYLTVTTIRRGEDVGTIKFYYGDFVKTRENAKYLMLYPTINTVYLIEKNMLPSDHLALIRSLLGFIAK